MLRIEILDSGTLDTTLRASILALCRDAYGEETEGYLADIGPGIHLLGRVGERLVTHAMFVERWLQVGQRRPMRTAYVELVATRVQDQRRGFASQVLRRLADEIRAFEIGALSPSEEAFYARFGWESWRGDLLVRTNTDLVRSPGEQLMVLRLPQTPGLSLDAAVSIEWRPGEVW